MTTTETPAEGAEPTVYAVSDYLVGLEQPNPSNIQQWLGRLAQAAQQVEYFEHVQPRTDGLYSMVQRMLVDVMRDVATTEKTATEEPLQSLVTNVRAMTAVDTIAGLLGAMGL